jgi:hypothetical protein
MVLVETSGRPSSYHAGFASVENPQLRIGDRFTAHLRLICDMSGSRGIRSMGGCVDHPDIDDLTVVELVPLGRSNTWALRPPIGWNSDDHKPCGQPWP